MGTDKELGLGNWKFCLVGKHVGSSPLDRPRRKWGMILKWVSNRF
jgi:hypothetical protein